SRDRYHLPGNRDAARTGCELSVSLVGKPLLGQIQALSESRRRLEESIVLLLPDLRERGIRHVDERHRQVDAMEIEVLLDVRPAHIPANVTVKRLALVQLEN